MKNRLAKISAFAFVAMAQLSGPLMAMGSRPADPNTPAPPAWVSLAPMAFIFVVFYMLLIRPQSTQRKQKQNMLNSLKKGDRVITQGGLIVTIMNMDPTTIDVKINDETRAKVLRSAITDIYTDTTVPQESAPVVTS